MKILRKSHKKFSRIAHQLKINHGYAKKEKESHAIARKPRDAAAVRFGLMFVDIHYKFKPSSESQASDSRHAGEKKNLTKMAIGSHSRLSILG